MPPTGADLAQWTLAVTGLLVAFSKLISMWGRSKRDVVDAHERRYDNSWQRVNEMLDDSQASLERCREENSRLSAELARCWDMPELNRRRLPRSSKGT